MASRNVIQAEFDVFCKGAGMLKKSGAWYRTRADVTQAVSLQKSQYSLSYYVNVGFWFQALGENTFPNERMWHVTIRLGSLIPDLDEEIRTLLDLESEIPAVERGPRFSHLLTSRLVPLLDTASSVEGLRELRKRGLLKAAAIRGPALPLLEAA